jgi:rod shape-determining protein MreC
VTFDPNSPELVRPVQALDHDAPALPAFIKRHNSFFVLLAVIGAQILLLSLQITRTNNIRLIRYWTVQAFDPLERSMGGFTNAISTSYRSIHDLWHAEQENQELHLQLVAAQTQVQRLSEQAAETQRLRTLLDLKNQLTFQTAAAEVIGSSMANTSSPGENSNAITLDKGSDAGFTTDLAVITPEGIVGKILAIFPHSAQVLLITDPSSGVGVTLAQSRVQGILKGGSDGVCGLHYIMNEEVMNRGDAVVTSGLDQVYPQGLPVGTVVTFSDGNIYKNITVKPAVDLNRLETVLVVLKSQAPEQSTPNGTR